MNGLAEACQYVVGDYHGNDWVLKYDAGFPQVSSQGKCFVIKPFMRWYVIHVCKAYLNLITSRISNSSKILSNF